MAWCADCPPGKSVPPYPPSTSPRSAALPTAPSHSSSQNQRDKYPDTSSADSPRTAPSHPAFPGTTPDALLYMDDPANIDKPDPSRHPCPNPALAAAAPENPPAYPAADESLCARPLPPQSPTDSPHPPVPASTSCSCPSARSFQ